MLYVREIKILIGEIWQFIQLLGLTLVLLVADVTTAYANDEPASEFEQAFVLQGIDFGNSGTKVPTYSICPEETTPAFSWSGAPEGTKAYVLTMHAPIYTEEEIAAGAEQRAFRYWWMLYNIPGSVSAVEAGKTAGGTLGTNIAKGEPALGYSPPCPRSGGTDLPVAFTLYALSDELELANPIEVTWEVLTEAMEDKLLASTTLRATFDRMLSESE